MERLNENEELKGIAPFLAGLPEADPFVAPDGFFERFPHQVQAAIAAQQPAAAPAWSWWKRISIALPIIALVGLGTWFLVSNNAPVEPVEVAVTPLSDSELQAMDDTDILAAFDLEDTEEITADDLGGVDIDLNDDELLAYLEIEDTDISELITDIE